MNCFAVSFPSRILVLLSSIACLSVSASEDDFVVDNLNEQSVHKNVLGAQHQKGVVIRNVAIVPIGHAAALEFEKMIFRQDGSVEFGDQRIKAEREQAINALDRAVQLTDNQKRRLDLAGEIDRRRFLDQVKAASQNLRAGAGWTKEDQQVIRQLEAKATIGLLGPESFFSKSIPVILDQNQLGSINERKRSIHGGLIRNALRDFEARLTLNEQQRESLTQIMLDEIPYDPTTESGELLVSKSERIMMMYRLSCYADKKIEALFDPFQWQKVRPMLEECYHYKEYLVNRGLLDPDADPNPVVMNVDDPTIRNKESK